MDKAIQLAGFFASHAVWVISKSKDGGVLVPLGGFESADEHRTLVEFDDDRFDLKVKTVWGGLEQQPALKRAGGDFDEGIFRDEAERARHTRLSVRSRQKLLVACNENSGTTVRKRVSFTFGLDKNKERDKTARQRRDGACR